MGAWNARFAVVVAPMVFAIGLLAFPARPAHALTAHDKFVRLSNNYMKAGITLPSSDYEKLAAYDVLVLPAEAQIFNPDFFPAVRRKNPDIVILAYVPTKSFAQVWSDNPADSLHRKLKARLDEAWRLRSPGGQILSVWPGTQTYNVSTGWNEALPRFVKEEVMSSGAWDGIFYDETSATISWLNDGQVDVNNDGAKDDPAQADRLWKEGMIRILKTTRELLGPGAVIVTNGDSDPDLQPHVNGRMFETFPTPWEWDGSWATVMNNYLRLHAQVGYPAVFLVNSNTGNTGNRNDFRKMRFGLASTLMGDGFFSFDHGDQDHGQLWLYDEYGAYLGKPVGQARNLTGQTSPVRPGVWRRDFQHGTVLVNSTDQAQTVDLGADFERLHGSQDPAVNNGEISDALTLPPQDGLILLRPLEQVREAGYRNGAFMRVLTNTGATSRNGFFAYDERQRGGIELAAFRPSAADSDVTVAAKGNRLELFDAQGRLLKTVFPFGEGWTKGLTLGVGKAGGRTYVAVGAAQGGEPLVRVYTEVLDPMVEAFHAYHPRFQGGVNVAVGDIDGDGSPDLATGAGAGGGPHVRVFGLDRAIKAQFFAYDRRFKGGVHVAVGDVDGDGAQEIVTGPGFGGGPHVRVFNRRGEIENQFFAFDSRKRGGTRVSTADVDGDGRAEILAMTSDVFTLAFGNRNLL
jgi:hypothetical protein